MLAIGLSTLYGLGRARDVELHECYEHLIAQAADLSAARAEADAAD